MTASRPRPLLLSAVQRLLLLVSASSLAVLIDSIPLLMLLYGVTLLAFFSCRLSGGKILFLLAMSTAAAWGFVVTQMFFYPYKPRTVLVELITHSTPIIGALTGSVAIYMEGILYGLMQSLRFLIMLTAGMSVVWTTSAHRLLGGLRLLRLPFKISFIVTMAIRFIPTITDEVRTVLKAMRLRGYPLHPLKPWSYVRALYTSLPTVLFRNIRRSALLSDSIESRGFALRQTGAGSLTRETSSVIGAGITVVALTLVAVIILLKAGSYAVAVGWLPLEPFRGVYGFVTRYL